MTKLQLAAAVAAKIELKHKNAVGYLDAILEAVTEALTAGEKVTLPGFGTFSVAERSARVGRNPRTGKELNIPAKNVVKFKPGKGLKEAVNS